MRSVRFNGICRFSRLKKNQLQWFWTQGEMHWKPNWIWETKIFGVYCGNKKYFIFRYLSNTTLLINSNSSLIIPADFFWQDFYFLTFTFYFQTQCLFIFFSPFDLNHISIFCSNQTSYSKKGTFTNRFYFFKNMSSSNQFNFK